MVSVPSDSLRRSTAKPTAVAFALAYLSTTFPRIATLLIALLRRRGTSYNAIREILNVLRQGLQLNRFPAFCATIVGGSLALRDPFNHVISSLDTKVHGSTSARRSRNNRVAARFLASLAASMLGFRLLNQQDIKSVSQIAHSKSEDAISRIVPQDGSKNAVDIRKPSRKSKIPPGMPPLPAIAATSKQPVVAMGIPLAGKTIDLTLFALVRAIDVLAQQWSVSKPPKKKIRKFFSDHASPILFAASSATIMHAFFYAPSHLPYTYVRWIDRIAECDERLLDALRQIYYGNFIYGKDTGIAPLLGSMAKDYGMPEVWGDPARTIPVPCELVHHGCGPSCELHALWRFWRAWKMALGVYAPLQAVILFRLLSNRKNSRLAAIIKVSRDAAKSSAFLGAFVALFYYGVCLSRTRLGPKLFDNKTVTPQMWDGGLCVTGGCLLCGWSVLLEGTKRQAELMLFVLPRALGVWVPRKYLLEHRWREETVFALSTAVVLTAAQERPERVRGVFGRILTQVVAR